MTQTGVTLADALELARTAQTGARAASAAGPGYRLVRASQVSPISVQWAWDGRIPLSMVTLLAGVGGLGKSTLLYSLAAGWTRGAVEGTLSGSPVNCVIASSEDHRSAVLVPRLLAAGADLDRVHFVEATVDGAAADIELKGEVEQLEAALREADARVLLIDTLVSHIPAEHDTFKEQHVRRVLTPVAHMAERWGGAVVATMHLNRREQRDVLSRISGSGGFGNLARSVMLLADDADDEGPTRLLAHAKSNVGPLAPTLRVRIDPFEITLPAGERITTSRMLFCGEAGGVAAPDLLAPDPGKEERGAIAEAAQCLRQVLGDGPVAAAEARREVKVAVGCSDRTIDEAKRRIGVVARKVGFGRPTKWEWMLPTAAKDAGAENGDGDDLLARAHAGRESSPASFGQTLRSSTKDAEGDGMSGGLAGSEGREERKDAMLPTRARAHEPTGPCPRCGGPGWHPPCRPAPQPWASGADADDDDLAF